MEPHRDVIPILLPIVLFVSLYGRRIFTVGGDQGGRVAKYLFQNLRIIYQHIASGSSHEDLDTAGLVRFQPADFLDIVIGTTQVESIVTPGTSSCQFKLVLQCL